STINTSGQLSIQGDNLGTNISGLNNSGELTLVASDHGAINSALEFATDSMEMYIGGTNDIATKAMFTTHELADNMVLANSENLAHLAGLQGSQAKQNADNINALKELATMHVDGGQSAMAEQMKYVIFAVLAAVVVLGVKRI
ncbi:chemotaxis protein, partial [Thaumasiovibrio sp. DFM-14]|uniref:chemotaxis protein n=1 Tax=Thaumasiovibrio sp. DFM-14 TaxID=3384792 RepID=UPI0039A307A4